MDLVNNIVAECTNPYSPRIRFQWNCLSLARGEVLNVGSCDDPAGFRQRVIHFDYDDWSEFFLIEDCAFVQGDAHLLDEIFAPKRFDLVILGDILEHVSDPEKVIRAACRVSNAVCMTVWEEWRNPERGCWIDETRNRMEQEVLDAGLDPGKFSYEDMYEQQHPLVKVNRGQPHLCHIWQFTMEDAKKWLDVFTQEGFSDPYAVRVLEVIHEGHEAYNYLIYASRNSIQG